MRRLMFGAIALAAAWSGWPALAQPSPAAAPPIRQFDQATLERMGREIYRQDRLAWQATDALIAKKIDPAKEQLRGWVTLPGNDKVRFVRASGSGLEAAYEVEASLRGKPRVGTPTDRTLSPDELALLAAKETAAKNIGPVCGTGYNFAAMKEADGNWIVWLLAPMRKQETLPIGGHYRFTISGDGKALIRRDALSNSCLVLETPKLPKGAQPLGLALNHVISDTPVETHVFASLQTSLPLIVLISGQPRWIVARGSIRPFTD